MKIIDDVYSLESTNGNLAYVIVTPPVRLIDTGHPGQGKNVIKELASLHIQPEDVRHIFLTHHDIDHIGNAAYLQRLTGAQVWASHIDIPYILGEKTRHGIKKLFSMLMRAEKPDPINPYPPVNELEGLKIIPTPGHTPGHVSLLYKDVLFAGDLVFCLNRKISLSPAVMTWDTTLEKESVRQAAALPFRWVCPAHGSPLERGNLWEHII